MTKPALAARRRRSTSTTVEDRWARFLEDYRWLVSQGQTFAAIAQQLGLSVEALHRRELRAIEAGRLDPSERAPGSRS